MEHKVCNNCVMDTSAEEITFNEKGICNFCIEYQKKEKVRKAEFLHPGRHWIFHELRKQKGYSCLLGLSGGIDSSMCLHYLMAENGIKPLCFSIDNGWNDSKADENIMRMVEKLKVPFYRFTINLKEFSDLQIAFVKAGVKNIEIPTDHILMAATYKMAMDNGIKYIISGGNLATEGIMPPSYGYEARDLTHIKAIFKKFMNRKLKDLPTISLFQYLYCRFIKGIKIINLLDFYDYKREEAKKLLAAEYGWKDYYEKHEESIYTKWFQNFYLPVKFQLDKRRPHYSSMINSGQMTRKEAMEKLAKPLKYPQLGCEERVLKYEKRSHFDYPTNLWLWSLFSNIYGIISNRK